MTDDLMAFLRQLPPGAVPEDRRPGLERHLASAWDSFSGTDYGGMEPYKLHDRMERAKWNPPVLTFSIERHRPTVHGSSRAPLQRWRLNIAERTASCGDYGFRQLRPLSPSLNVGLIAEGIVNAVLGHEEHPHLDWLKNGGVRVRTTELLGGPSIPKQTMEGCRKRFGPALARLLAPHGWARGSGGVYRQRNPAGDRP